jgi:histidine ammonia-lyase
MVTIDGNSLSIEALVKVARFGENVQLSADALTAIRKSQDRLKELISRSKPVYGLNTGFGIFADHPISNDQSKQLNRNLILSHAVGTGDPLPEDVVRAAMLVRANALAKGFSGIGEEIIATLVEMLNKHVTPVVCSKGSLGSSGDLCMLAQMALVMTRGEKELDFETGQAYFEGKLLDGRTAMQKAGIERLVLSNKDGLALINGATFTAALLALSVYDAGYDCCLADLAAALSYEALLGRTDALHPELHRARGLQGQMQSAANISKILDGSTFVNSHNHVQDAYSLRCTPQVHGAVRDTLDFVTATVTREINAATDNPLIVDDGLVISGGNFHGEPLGMAADFLGIACSELAAIAERRTFKLLDEHLNNGLPAMLVDEQVSAGLNSGIMILQYTAAALVLENQTLSSPDSVRSLPTSANQEDHNANSYNAAYHTRQILENTAKVLAIEIYAACRGIDLRKKENPSLQLGRGTTRVYHCIRDIIPFQTGDALWKKDIDQLNQLLFEDVEFYNNFCGKV